MKRPHYKKQLNTVLLTLLLCLFPYAQANAGLGASNNGSATVLLLPSAPGSVIDLSSNSVALMIPAGTSAQRPSTANLGEIRYNTTIGSIEAYQGSSPAWVALSGGSSGGGSSTTPVTTITSSGAAQAIAFPSTGNAAYDITLSASCVITLTGGTAGQLQTVTLILRQNSTAGWTPTLPNGVRWPGGVMPTPNTLAGKIDLYKITTSDAGVTLFGSY